MSENFLEKFVAQAQRAAAAEDATSAIHSLMQHSQLRKDEFADAIAEMSDDEVMLFEDNTCSIWTCRYNANIVLAPHEHRMGVHIAVYRGTEVQVLYKREPGKLRLSGNTLVRPGDVLHLGEDAVHAVTADGSLQSHAIHVYEGPLTQVQRSLFDWATGEEVKFTMENFHAMARNKTDMHEFR